MSNNKKFKIDCLLFYLTLVFSCLAFVGCYIYAKRSGLRLMISYDHSKATVQTPIALLFRFGKDFFVLVLFLYEILMQNNTSKIKILIWSSLITVLGVIIALFNDLHPYVILSGCRMVLLFVTLLLFFSEGNQKISLVGIFRLVVLLLFINTVVAMVQTYEVLGFNVGQIGSASFRFMGFFPFCATYGYYCLCTVLLCYCLQTKNKNHGKYHIIICLVAFMGCWLSGTRSAMTGLIIVLFYYLTEIFNLKRSTRTVLFITCLLPILCFAIKFSIDMADRGNMIDGSMNGGRITRFIDYGFKRSVCEIIVGKGLGAGCNSASKFVGVKGNEADVEILDGTFTTILYEYGIIGLLVGLAFLTYLFNTVRNSAGVIPACIFSSTVVILCLATNIFEVYAILPLLFVCYNILLESRNDGHSQWRRANAF